MTKSKLLRMDNVAIVVRDLKAAVSFFSELGLELEGKMTVEGEWVDRIVGLYGVRTDIAMMRTPDGHNKLELMEFQSPVASTMHPNAPVNALGIRRIMFVVTDIDEVAVRLQKHGAKLVGEKVRFEDINGKGHRLCYLRNQEGLIVALAEQLGTASENVAETSTTKKPSLLGMDNVLIVVDDLEAARSFFIELGLQPEGETTVEGPSVDSLIGLSNVRATLSLMRTPDGHGRIELDKFHTPPAIRIGAEDAPVNTLGYCRVMFAVDDIDDFVERLRAQGAGLVGEVVNYEDTYRLCYVRGPEGIIVGLAEQLR